MQAYSAPKLAVNIRWYERTKSFATKGSPLDHFAFARRWKVYFRPSSEISHFSATPGLGASVTGSAESKPSWRARERWYSYTPVVVWESKSWGSSPFP